MDTFIEDNAHIPTSEIEADIALTQKEIDDFEAEKEVLMRNPQANKVRIYMLGGHILQRVGFIAQLQKLIDARK